MPIIQRKQELERKPFLVPSFLDFWSNKENAKIRAKRSAHIEKQDCSRGLLFLYPFIVWIQAAPG